MPEKALLCERQEAGGVGAPTGAHQGILCPQSAWKENTFTAVSKSTLSGYTTKIRGENRAVTGDQGKACLKVCNEPVLFLISSAHWELPC